MASTSKGELATAGAADAEVEAATTLFEVCAPAVIADNGHRQQIQCFGHDPKGAGGIAGLMLEELGQLDGRRIGIALGPPAFIEDRFRLRPAALPAQQASEL